jgi:hypothetical protein
MSYFVYDLSKVVPLFSRKIAPVIHIKAVTTCFTEFLRWLVWVVFLWFLQSCLYLNLITFLGDKLLICYETSSNILPHSHMESDVTFLFSCIGLQCQYIYFQGSLVCTDRLYWAVQEVCPPPDFTVVETKTLAVHLPPNRNFQHTSHLGWHKHGMAWHNFQTWHGSILPYVASPLPPQLPCTWTQKWYCQLDPQCKEKPPEW